MAASEKASLQHGGLSGPGGGLNRKRGKGKKKQKGQERNQVSSDKQSAELKRRKSKNGNQISINKQFAERYEHSKRRQLLANTPANLLESDSESSSSSEEEDEFAEQWTKKVDRRFRETFDAITKKDPKIYDPKATFFSAPDEGDASNAESVDEGDEPVAGWDTIAKAAEEQRPKMTLKDYVREQLVTHGGLGESDSDGDAGGIDDEGDAQNGSTAFEKNSKRKLRKPLAGSDVEEVSNGVHPGQSGNGISASGESDSDDDFFTKKEKTDAEMEEENKEFEKFLAKKALKESRQRGEDLLLHSYLENENPDEKERFLRDFVMNNGWLDKNAGEAPLLSEYAIELDKTKVNVSDEDEEDDDDFDDRNDMFESQHNFRFEDPDGAQITGHARNIMDTMRRPDDRRKKAREARKERKRREKEEKTEEIKRLKNLKKREIQARLLAIQEAAGGIDVSGVDLDADYDPEAFDKQMNAKFGDDYYAQEDEGIKKVVTEDMAHASEGAAPAEKSEVVPEDIRADVDKLMDEYYNLDYEDIVAGKPTRFSYKKVEEESFGLTAEEILEMDDKELNRIVSLKYVAPYHPRNVVKRQAWKARAALQKHKKAKQQQAFDEDDGQAFDTSEWPENGSGDHSSGKRKKKRRRQDEANANDSTVGEADEEQSTRTPSKSEPSETQPSGVNGQKNNETSKRKRKKRKRSADASATVLDSPTGAKSTKNNATDEADATGSAKRRRTRRRKPRSQVENASVQDSKSSTAADTPSTEIVNPEEGEASQKKKKKKKKTKSSTMAEFSENRLKAYGLKVDR